MLSRWAFAPASSRSSTVFSTGADWATGDALYFHRGLPERLHAHRPVRRTATLDAAVQLAQGSMREI